MTSQPKKSKEEILAGMDAAAETAKAEFTSMCNSIDKDAVAHIRNWWERNFTKVGHKRLAYILMGKA